jgi:Zn-finger protein
MIHISYQNWIEQHSKKHSQIVAKLLQNNQNISDEEIIEYFSYDNMQKYENDFCPLYKENKKCHDIDELNCYLCGCPNFRLEDTKSHCNINSKYGAKITAKDGFIHQDCSGCGIPHQKTFIKKYFDRDWQKIMQNVINTNNIKDEEIKEQGK